MPTLKGLTWKHDRGVAPLLATARAFRESHPDISIEWDARSLHEFGDVSVAGVAADYDLIVIDHPFMGEAARDRFLIPLDLHLDAETLATFNEQSVGASHRTYFFDGHQWALAIDAAAQVAGYRADLLREVGMPVPTTWDDVFELAKVRRGFVTLPLLPLDSMMCFFSLCANLGYPAFASGSGAPIDPDAAETALLRLRALAETSGESAVASNPIAVWERMSSTADHAYCPLAFGYSNYARAGYRPFTLSFANVPASGSDGPVGATLGGAGLAVTANCRDVEIAVLYATWVASAECQRTLYVQAGGQPGNRVAWMDPAANQLTGDYFQSTLATLEHAYVRPRFANFVAMQTAGAQIVWKFIQGEMSPAPAVRALDEIFRTRETP